MIQTAIPHQVLTAAEAEVMNLIWEVSPTTIPEIVERMPRPLAYTTIMTTVRILEDKGFVTRCGKRGRAFIYEPSVAKRAVRRSMAHQLADLLFGGSVKSMVLNLVQDDCVPSEDLSEVRRLIELMESHR